MKSLKFNEGLESFMVNDDPGRVIYFNTADPEIINRLLKMQSDFKDYKPEEDIELKPDGSPKDELEKEAAYVAEFTKAMRKDINDVFNADMFDTIFNGQSPLCIVGTRGKEKYLFEEVIDALMGIMGPAIEAYNRKSEKKMNKYLGDI